MTHLKCNSIDFFIALILIGTCDSIAASLIHPESSIMIVRESRLINDTIHQVGDLFGGGVIFFVDNTGHHGLIYSMSEIRDPRSLELYKRQDPRPLKGRKDSAALFNQVFSVDNPERAEELCINYTNSNYGTGVFSDWYLPTSDELERLFKVKQIINKILENYSKAIIDPLDKIYWSSSKIYDEVIGSNWLVDFDGGSLVIYSKFRRSLPGKFFVRATRTF